MARFHHAIINFDILGIVTVQDLKEEMSNNVLVIDVRNKTDFENVGRLEKSVNIPYPDILNGGEISVFLFRHL